MSGNNNKAREINVKLLCPSLSKVIQVVAWDDQRIDLGFICRAFGLDPSTVKLNGYYISRGVDLVASSVTWKSLVSFFSSKGLSTGKDQRDPLVVTGKLCKLGHKRRHDSQDFQNRIDKVMDGANACNSGGIQPEAFNLLKNKKFKQSKSGEILNGLRSKRKQLLEDVNLFKKLKINEDKSGNHAFLPSCAQGLQLAANTFNGLFADIRDRVDDVSGSIARSQFTCS